MLTNEQAQVHLENSGSACPYCGANDISGSQIEVDAGVASQRIRCQRCGEEWIDYYSMDGVAVDDDQGDLVVFEMERRESC